MASRASFHHAIETPHRSAASSGPGNSERDIRIRWSVSRVPCRGPCIESNRLFARPPAAPSHGLQPSATSGYTPYVRTYSKCTVPRAPHHLISSHRINPAIAKERPDMDHACNVLSSSAGQSVSHVKHREVRERERQNTQNLNHPFCVAILDAPTVFHSLLATQRPSYPEGP